MGGTIPLETLGRGTGVTLDLKENADDHVKEEKLKGTARKYSWSIHFPIYVETNGKVDADVDEDEDDDEENTEDLESMMKKEKKTTKQTMYEWEQENVQKAIWLRTTEDNHFVREQHQRLLVA